MFKLIDRLNSINLPHYKNSAEKNTINIPIPPKVIIPMVQHIGTPCTPCVKKGDEVKVGQLLGDSEAFVSSPVHSSVSGVVSGIEKILLANGNQVEAIVIDTDGKQNLLELSAPTINNKDDFVKAIRKSGIIGLGGAGFPTSVKITYDKEKTPVDTLIVNGAECEPFITSDYREFLENGKSVVEGLKLFLKYLDIEKGIIAIESNKPKAIEYMKRLTKDIPNINVSALKTNFPQGAEKVIIHSVTKRRVKAGQLPVTTGCLVINASTISFVYDYINTGMPLINRRLTVDGNAVKNPVNILVPIGTSLEYILENIDLIDTPDKIVLGGPMMGITALNTTNIITKTSNAILLFKQEKEIKPTACIKCGACVDACSMNLLPTELEHAYDRRDIEELKSLRVDLCMNCGACSFVCPANRRLAQKHQLAKALIK